MNLHQHIIKNIVSMVSSQALFAASLFVFNVLIARYLGDAEFGKYSFAIAFTSLFGIFSSLGLEAVVTRDVVLDKSVAGKYFGNALVLQVIGSIFMFFLVMLTINLSQNAQDARTVVYIVALGTIATSFVYLCRAIFRAFEKMEWDIVPTVAGTCFLLGVGFLSYTPAMTLCK